MKAEFDFPDPYWTDISGEAKDFIQKLLLADSKKRLTATSALKHPWIEKGGSGKVLNVKDKMSNFNNTRKESKANLGKK